MCGFIGVFHKDPNHIADLGEIIETNELEKRGPDEKTFFQNRNLAIKFFRLSIIGGDDGKQPIFDGNNLLIFNGEIYNFKELSQNLHSDTQCLFKILKNNNNDDLEKLKGMFSFVYWDKKNNTLSFGRDFWGKKPLYFINYNNSIYFSSSVKALTYVLDSKLLNKDFLSSYFTYGYSVNGGSPFTEILESPSGKVYFPVNKKSIKINIIKNIENLNRLSRVDVIDKCKHLLIKNLKRKSHSKSALYLSEGIDSGIINKILIDLKLEFKSFTIQFEDHFYNEFFSNLSKQNHEDITISKEEFTKAAYASMGLDGNLHSNPANIGFYLLSKYTKKYSPVALTGGGGDELFFGYPTWKANRLSEFTNKISRRERDILIKILDLIPKNYNSHSKIYALKKILSLDDNDYELRHFYWRSLVSRSAFSKIFNNNDYGLDLFKKLKKTSLKELGLTDLSTWWKNMGLKQADMFGMANSVEIRSIFCDEELLNFCYSINQNYHKPISSKSLLLDVAKTMNVAKTSKYKKPFSVPLNIIYNKTISQDVIEEFKYNARKLNIEINKDEIDLILKGNINHNLFFIHTLENFNVWVKKTL